MAISNAKFHIFIRDGAVECRVLIDGISSCERCKIPLFEIEGAKLGQFICWALGVMKPILFLLPELELDVDIEQGSQVKRGFELIEKIIVTNFELMRSLAHLKGSAAANTKTLFYNIIDNPSYRALYDEFQKVDADRCVYREFDIGFDCKTRTWRPTDLPIEFDGLLKLIADERIKTIVSINHNFLEQYLEKKFIYLPAIFKWLGVEYIIFDNDAFEVNETHLFAMRAFHCNDFRRFYLSPIFQKPWHDKYSLRNTHYSVVPERFNQNSGAKIVLAPPYDLVLLSGSRIDSVLHHLEDVLYLIDRMGPERIFSDLTCWYLALRGMLLDEYGRKDVDVMPAIKKIHWVFYGAAMQFMKYEVVSWVTGAGFNLEIYGDNGWGKIFPDHYMGKYLTVEEKRERLSRGNVIHLIINFLFHYLEASGVIYEGLSGDVPFINLAAPVRTNLTEGLRHVEYSNRSELVRVIANIKMISANKELKSSVAGLQALLSRSMQHTARRIVDSESADDPIVTKELAANLKLLTQLVDEYRRQNGEFLKESFRRICLGDPCGYDYENSPYMSREFMPRLMDLKLGRDVQ